MKHLDSLRTLRLSSLKVEESLLSVDDLMDSWLSIYPFLHTFARFHKQFICKILVVGSVSRWGSCCVFLYFHKAAQCFAMILSRSTFFILIKLSFIGSCFENILSLDLNVYFCLKFNVINRLIRHRLFIKVLSKLFLNTQYLIIKVM